MEALKGKNSILLFRLLEDAAKNKAAKLAFQTEHSVEKSKDSDVTETKDGQIVIGQGKEEEISFSCVMGDNDPTIEMLERSFDEDKTLEVWEVDVTPRQNGAGEYPAIYRQGIVTEFNKSANVEDLMTLEMSFKTSGQGQKGMVKLTQEQQEVVQYKFTDTEPKTV